MQEKKTKAPKKEPQTDHNSSLTYNQAFQELNTLVQELQSDSIDVDQLSKKVKRASQLIKFCKGKLRETDEEVKKVLDDLDIDSIACDTEEEEGN